MDKAALLRASWLSGFPDTVVTEAADCGVVKTYDDGELVHARGAEGDGFYTIADGAVRFSRATADGQSSVIAVLTAPAAFGEISLFDGLPRTHDAHAAGPASLMFHARSDFRRLLQKYPAVFERFARVLSLRLRATFDLVEEAAIAPFAQRLARRLLELAHIKPFATDCATLAGRDVPLTQEELGQLVGKSRQSVSRLLQQWEQNGLIETKYGRIAIRRGAELCAIAYPERGMLLSHEKEV